MMSVVGPVVIAAFAIAAVSVGPVAAQSAVCSVPTIYPGDAASPEAIAAWMAERAMLAGLPGELPVIAALAQSELRNVPASGTAGYFLMSQSVWGTGVYAGFPTNPELQLRWFIDQAFAARAREVAAGDADFGVRPRDWGEWAAGALGPAAHRPARYQRRLREARRLIGGGIVDAAACSFQGPYPGDTAARATLTAWMATRAMAAGLPAELPVMAALVESGLRNITFGDADSVGFFQIRVSIWNQGPYAGFPTNPELQIKWFIDQATAVRARAVAAGDPTFGYDPARWGEWDADVIRPPEQFRGRYQFRLDEARDLIASGCSETP
jgi:hypothetical protein